MITKDHTKWNLDVLQDIVEGPLLNQKRMEEAIKVTKFMRKLMSFFHPFNHRYSDIPRRVIQPSCSIFALSFDKFTEQCSLGQVWDHSSQYSLV